MRKKTASLNFEYQARKLMKKIPQKANRLIHEKSPYLLQHAYNPVDWYPWGAEAFEIAQRLDKPIFLSIGYATCHWCHVMERESFEDPEVAAKMNLFFVNIKVDREELPDVDRFYMEFAQGMMTGSAGWPLNLMLTPHLEPFFAITYCPPKSQHGMVGLLDLIEQIHVIWNSPAKEQVIAETAAMIQEFSKHIHVEGDRLPEEKAIAETATMLYKIADPIYGGIKGAPKFPVPHQTRFLMNYCGLKSDSRALFLVEKTLDGMFFGGIYDHLGGGFCRYSTDEAWRIPHFEKMLSDNAQLAVLYLDGWKFTKNDLYTQVCKETLDYILREMTGKEKGFHSAQDADSEGNEGLFYTWTRQEIFSLFDDAEASLLCDFFDVLDAGNFEGRTVLSVPPNPAEFAEERGMSLSECTSKIQDLKQKLWKAREQRIPPFKDDKVLTSWNGLMLHAFAETGAALGIPRYLEQAVQTARFLKNSLWKEDHLLHRWREGEAKFRGGLEDYAFLIKGLLSLFEAGCGTEWLIWSIELTNILENHFKSPSGAFFQTEEGGSDLLLRLCSFSDGAEPSGNAIHCENLLRLYQITAEPRFLDQASDILMAVRKYFDSYSPAYTCHASNLLRFYDRSAATIVVALNKNRDHHREIFQLIWRSFRPHHSVVWKEMEEDRLLRFIPALKSQVPLKNQTTVYICRQGVCEKPLHEIEEIRQSLFSL